MMVVQIDHLYTQNTTKKCVFEHKMAVRFKVSISLRKCNMYTHGKRNETLLQFYCYAPEHSVQFKNTLLS